jgi:hypothetical protein
MRVNSAIQDSVIETLTKQLNSTGTIKITGEYLKEIDSKLNWGFVSTNNWIHNIKKEVELEWSKRETFKLTKRVEDLEKKVEFLMTQVDLENNYNKFGKKDE